MVAEKLGLMTARQIGRLAGSMIDDLLLADASAGAAAPALAFKASTPALGARVSTSFASENLKELSALVGKSGALDPVFKHEATELPLALAKPASSPGPVPYKVLTSEGHSPAARGVKWSLPELRSNGEWKPGSWLSVDGTPENAYHNGAPLFQSRRALHVSDSPGEWSFNQRQLRLFEAELHPVDKALWNKVAVEGPQFHVGPIPASLRDFPAREVRLTRELFGKELLDVLKRDLQY